VRLGHGELRFLGAIALLLFVPVGRAQTTVSLVVEQPTAFVGESFPVTIRIEDFEDAELPEFPPLSGATVVGTPSESNSSQTFISGGRRIVSRSRVYTYQVLPTQPGPLTIPPLEVQVDGRALRTQPVTIQIKPSDAQDLFWVEVSAAREHVYVGQRVRLILKIYVKVPSDWGPLRATRCAPARSSSATRPGGACSTTHTSFGPTTCPTARDASLSMTSSSA
jgi:hypothetical protein